MLSLVTPLGAPMVGAEGKKLTLCSSRSLENAIARQKIYKDCHRNK